MQDLNRHYDLHRQLNTAKEMLQSLQDAAVPGAQVLTGMPHAPGVKDKVGSIAVEIADLRTSIEAMERELVQGRMEIEVFVAGITDVSLRTVFRLRYLRYLSWGDIEELLGWKQSEEALRQRCRNYMKRLQPEENA